MWDKNLDEGIFLCDYKSDILTVDFLQRLNYVNAQLQVKNWLEPSQFITNQLEFVSYIILTHSKEVANESYHTNNIKVSNRQQNDIFQGELALDFCELQLFIYKLFDSEAKFDTICARCGRFVNRWEEECEECRDYKDWEWESELPEVGTVYCSNCDGHNYRSRGKWITYYCKYNMKTKERGPMNCIECKEHFDWLEKINLQ